MWDCQKKFCLKLWPIQSIIKPAVQQREYAFFHRESPSNYNLYVAQGCILHLKLIFFAPPPFLINFFPNEIYYIEGCAPQGKFSALFFAILVILSQLGEKYAYFLPIDEKICIFPPFFIPFQSFFPQHVIWPYFCPSPARGGGGQNKKI